MSFDSTFNLDRIEKYVDILLNKNFIVYRINGDADFITSDNPVMFMDSITLDVKPFSNGLLDNRTVVFFPLSPKILVVIYSSEFLLGSISQYDGKILFIDASKDKRFILNHNNKQCEQSYNQVYARNISDLEVYNRKNTKKSFEA